MFLNRGHFGNHIFLHLIISKLYWARDSRSEIQLQDVKNLLETVSNLNKTYLEEWVGRLDLEDIYKGVAQ